MIKFFAKHPTAANLLMIVIALSGIISLKGIIRETFPKFALKTAEVRVVYPGASPVEIEYSVCSRLEDKLEGIPGVDEIISESREGMARVVVSISQGYDFSRFLNDIKTEVESISDFPDMVEQITIREIGRNDPVVSIAVSGEISYSKLKIYAESLKSRLMELSTVNLVTLDGVSDMRLKISIDEEKLTRLGLSISDVAKKIKFMNIEVPLGLIKTEKKEYILRYSDLRKTPSEMGKVVIHSGSDGSEVLLSEIAEIKETFEFEENRIIFDERHAILLKIEKNPADDTLNIFAEIKNFVDQERLVLPSGIKLELTQDISSNVSDRLNLIIDNGLLGIMLVFLVLYMFFGFKLSFWVSLGLPVSFLGGLFMMKMLGMTINMLSMVGLLLAIGLLMDDAIVISENIATATLNAGDNYMQAGIDATLEVFPGVFSSYLTTVGVFGGMMFLDGDLGRLLKAIPAVLLLVMSVSLIEAFLILPHHLIQSASGGKTEIRGIRKLFDIVFTFFQSKILPVLVRFCIKFRYVTLGLIFAILILSVGMLAGRRLKFSAMPDIEGDVIQARILLAQGTPLKVTEKVVNHIVKQLERVNEELKNKQPGDQDLVRHVTSLFSVNLDIGDSGTHVATVSADLLPAEIRNSRLGDIFDLWRKYVGNLPEVQGISFKEPVIGPSGRPVHIRIHGKSFDNLKKASDIVINALSEFDGISDIIDDMKLGKSELQISLLPGAQRYGITAAYLATQLRTAFQGELIDTIQQGEETFEVSVQFSMKSQKDLSVLDNFEIVSPNGKRIPLTNIARISSTRGWSRINRVNGKRAVTVYAEADTRKTNVMEVLSQIEKEVFPEIKKKYPGITFQYEGQVRKVSDAMPSMRLALILGMITVFLVLSYQFGSWLEPLFIMIAIPLSLIGVVWGHIIMKMDLCLPSMVGFISLAGVVVNNSILLVHFIKSNLDKCENITEAAIEAARRRSRPIFITTMTTVAGMLPMLLEKSLQAQILIPLTISMVFGLVVSTATVIFVIPCVYKVVDDFGYKIKSS
ncbi:efflux RND transporter permease subunit [bacterium]|nr:efflux RND transporter permease subunit [bacterium]